MSNEEIYIKKEDIGSIIKRLSQISFDELKRHPHYEYSLMQKNTNENLIRETYPEFHRIKLIKKTMGHHTLKLQKSFMDF